MTLWVPPQGLTRTLGSHASVRPGANFGATVTPGTGAYGSWVNLFSALTYAAAGIMISMNTNYASAASRNSVVKLGIDPAGGTSYTDLIPGLICGGASAYAGASAGGVWYYFPVAIPAGASVAVAAYGSVATDFYVNATLETSPRGLVQAGSVVEAIGLASNYVGTAITAGTTSEGAWTSLGTTTRALWWWQVGMQISTADTNWTGTVFHVDLAYGDASNKTVILEDWYGSFGSAEVLHGQGRTLGCEHLVPAGATLYARAQCSGSADPLVVAAYGVGG